MCEIRWSAVACLARPRRRCSKSWFAFGEDAEVIDAGESGWRSATELGDFVDNPAGSEDRDWRALDPRRIDVDDEDE